MIRLALNPTIATEMVFNEKRDTGTVYLHAKVHPILTYRTVGSEELLVGSSESKNKYIKVYI